MMRLGKIDYLNLLPFDVFIKASPLSSQFKAILAHKKSYPAKLNRDFLFSRLDAGFFSSILSYGARMDFPCGIVAHGEVWSVLALPRKDKKDAQSASSNALIRVLGMHGEVLIGDKALLYRLGGGEAVDLGKAWQEKKRRPFVFALFCASSHRTQAGHIASRFIQRRIKIPLYLLRDASRRSGVAPRDILLYLQKISYRIGKREQEGLKAFYRELLFCGIKKPSRFEVSLAKRKESECKKL